MQQQHFGVHSSSQTPRLWRWLVRGIVAIGAFLLSVLSAWAAPIPFADRDVQLVAREQPVALFLQDLFGLIDLPVSVSPAVKGAVNGNFNGPAERVWRDVSRSLGVVSYYDGAVVHVYTPAELGTRTLPMPASVSERVLRTARELRMLDARHSLRSTREGALVAMGTRRFLEQIEELARSQSASLSASPPLGFKVFYLRYAWAQDVSINFGGRQTVVPGVAAIVRALMTSNPRSQVQIAPLEQMQRPTVPRLRGSGLAAQGGIAGANGTLGAAGANPGAPSADTLIAAYGGTQPPAGGGAPMGAWATPTAYANYSGVPVALGDAQQVRVEADTRLNAVIVRDAPERLPQYEQLVNALDVEPQALEIEATIIDVDTDRLRELGVNWRLSRGRSSLLLGEGNDNDRLLDGANVPPAGITPEGRGGFLSAVLGGGNELAVRLRALEEQGAAKVVSSPQVLTLSNVEAMFDTSRTFYVRVQGKDEVDLFSVSAGTTLRVTPHVFKDRDEVRIKLLVSIDDGALTQQQVDAIPVVERATINTQALIAEGESLLIGGLTREASRNGVQRVPVLGSIPLIGGLFRTTSESNQRTERMFLIVPRLAAAGKRALQPASPAAATSSPTPAPASPPSAPAEPGRQP
jgi:type III secretion protein C